MGGDRRGYPELVDRLIESALDGGVAAGSVIRGRSVRGVPGRRPARRPAVPAGDGRLRPRGRRRRRRPAPAERSRQSAEELGALVVAEVPSGLPRLPDDELEPPAGAKAVEDVAEYADDPAREREVLEDYGYRYGWERFWGDRRRAR